MTAKAHPDDLLVLANLGERSAYRQFADRQALPATLPNRAYNLLSGERTVRTVWVSDLARGPEAADIVRLIEMHCNKTGQALVLRPAADWEPEPPSLVTLIRELASPSKNAQVTQGYNRAKDDVLSVIAEWFEEVSSS